jgi:hypothetical protein
MGRQHELFARADIPAHVPRIEHYAAVERRRVEHNPRPVLWEGMGSWVRQLASFPEGWQRSAEQDERFRKIARLLDVEKVRLCRHEDGLALVEERLADFRNNDLGTVFSRAELGELLVEARNRIAQLRLGRAVPKVKGPRFDVTRLPIDAIERLIQSHPDMAIVEQLRAERARRR